MARCGGGSMNDNSHRSRLGSRRSRKWREEGPGSEEQGNG